MKSSKVYIGREGQYMLYEVVRDGRTLVSVQNKDGAEVMLADTVGAAREWVRMKYGTQS